jgi:putative transposase
MKKSRFSDEEIINFLKQPTQNAYVESFNGKFRDECLNEHRFRTLAEARMIVAAWRLYYNQVRPHSALEYRTPAEFAATWRTQHSGSPRQATAGEQRK